MTPWDDGWLLKPLTQTFWHLDGDIFDRELDIGFFFFLFFFFFALEALASMAFGVR